MVGNSFTDKCGRISSDRINQSNTVLSNVVVMIVNTRYVNSCVVFNTVSTLFVICHYTGAFLGTVQSHN